MLTMLSRLDCRVKDTVESAKSSLREAAESIEPKTAEEAIQVSSSWSSSLEPSCLESHANNEG